MVPNGARWVQNSDGAGQWATKCGSLSIVAGGKATVPSVNSAYSVSIYRASYSKCNVVDPCGESADVGNYSRRDTERGHCIAYSEPLPLVPFRRHQTTIQTS